MNHSTVGILTTILCANSGVVNANDLTISVRGECPGRIELSYDGATPGTRAALAFSQENGAILLPVGPCGGTWIGLGNIGLRLVRTFQTSPDGLGSLSGHSSEAACGGYLQLLVQDGHPCATSNVVQIP